MVTQNSFIARLLQKDGEFNFGIAIFKRNKVIEFFVQQNLSLETSRTGMNENTNIFDP